jgi:hypothetical protein
MKSNVGTMDRLLRVVVGLVLVLLAATDRIGMWGWIGVVPLLTAFVGYCPLYQLLGMRTNASGGVSRP